MLAFYEFLIGIVGIAGVVVIIARRIRSRFALWCLLWAVLSVTFYLWTAVHAAELIMQIVVPIAFVGAFAIDYLHHTYAWQFIRFPIAALALLTAYVLVLTVFVYRAPDASEAPWTRHANLYWHDGATTLQTRERCAEIVNRIVPADATVFANHGWAPALRWYLRALRPVADPEVATVQLDPVIAPDSESDEDHKFEFDFEESWVPQVDAIDPESALRYLFTAQVWGKVRTRRVTILVTRSGPSAPTVILPPAAMP
jgi:hypothetical protein